MKFTHALLPVAAALLTISFTAPAHAQRGDRKGQEQPEVWRDMDVPPAPVVPPDKALSTFKIAPNFRLELVAAEPLVNDPVAITWDADGRMWVVEMRGYMPNVDGKGEGEEKIGRVVVLEDTNNDGKMDKQTVFLDGLQMPRALAIVEDTPGVKGLLVAEPPHLWYCRDTDGDLKCDAKTEAYDHYGSQGPVEHTDNGLMWALDNKIYNAKTSKRFTVHVNDGKLDLAPDDSIARGQWGITQDNYGRIYSNSNSSYLQVDDALDGYYSRNPAAQIKVGTRSIASDQNVWSIRVNPGINRGYQKGMLRPDGRQSRTTGTCGLGVYRGDQYPTEYVGDLFIPEPCGNVVTLHELTDVNGPKTKHVIFDDDKWEHREFLASTDERFRPVNTYTGPDGCMYVVDLYRGILQHRIYVTTFLRKQIIERGLDKPTSLGRIYRIVYTGPNAKKPGTTMPMLSKLSGVDLAAHLAHANGWYRDTAQRLIVLRGDQSAVPTLTKMATSHADPLARLHALWTLDGLGAMDKATAIAAIGDADPRVAAAAMRCAESLLKTEDAPAIIERLANVTRSKDAELRTQALLSLGQTVGPARDAAEAVMLDTLTANVKDSATRNAVLSGLTGREAVFLSRLAKHAGWATNGDSRDAFVRDLAATIYRRGNADEIGGLLATASVQPADQSWRAAAMLDGIAGSSKKPKPVTLAEKPAAMATLLAAKDASVAKKAKAIENLISWKGDTRAPVATGSSLSPADQKRAAEGKTYFMVVCMACHQLHGQGLAGLAPSLVDSPYVLGDPERLTRIALLGLQGPVTINDEEWNLVMPGHKDNPLLTDQRLADVLTYIRNEWDNEASAVDPAVVTKIRASLNGRNEPWTIEELDKLSKKKKK
ncbi:MAG: c-type cytochrome [Phycisphaera sp.]|nr:c-type cytochrome [Phycisphaera sp.]